MVVEQKFIRTPYLHSFVQEIVDMVGGGYVPDMGVHHPKLVRGMYEVMMVKDGVKDSGTPKQAGESPKQVSETPKRGRKPKEEL